MAQMRDHQSGFRPNRKPMFNNYSSKKTTPILLLLPLLALLTASGATAQSTGILNIQSSPGGATVFLDGKIRGTTPLLLEVAASDHDLKIKLKGYQTYSGRVSVKPDKVSRTRISLTKKQSPPNGVQVKKGIKVHIPNEQSKPGTIFLSTTPKGLTAYVDGYAISQNTPVAFDIRPGIYELVLRNEKSEVVYRKTIFVRSGKTLTLDIVVQKKRTIDYSDPWL